MLWNDPDIAARAANLLAESYVDHMQSTQLRVLETARELTEERIEQTRIELRALEGQLRDFKKDATVYMGTDQLDNMSDELSSYLQEYSAVRITLRELAGKITVLKEHQGPTGRVLAEADRKALEARRKELSKVIREQVAKLQQYPAKEYELVDLERRKQDLEAIIAELADSVMETRISEAVLQRVVRTIDPALPPVYPGYPQVFLYSIAAVFAGVIFGLIFMLLREYQYDFLRTPADFVELGVTLAGVIPCAATCRSWPWFKVRQDALRERLDKHIDHLARQILDGKRHRVITWLSARERAGKRGLIEALISSPVLAGTKMLVVETRPGAQPTAGLFAPLAEAEEGSPCRVNDRVDAIAIHFPEESGETQLSNTVEACKRRYDLVFVVAPAAQCGPRSEEAASPADDIICVFDAARSARHEVDMLMTRCDGFRGRLSAVLTNVKYTPVLLFV